MSFKEETTPRNMMRVTLLARTCLIDHLAERESVVVWGT